MNPFKMSISELEEEIKNLDYAIAIEGQTMKCLIKAQNIIPC